MLQFIKENQKIRKTKKVTKRFYRFWILSAYYRINQQRRTDSRFRNAQYQNWTYCQLSAAGDIIVAFYYGRIDNLLSSFNYFGNCFRIRFAAPRFEAK